MSVHSFPVPLKEFDSLTHAVPTELIQLVKSHLSYCEYQISQPVLTLDGLELTESVTINIFAKLFKEKTKLYLEESFSGDLKLWTLTGEGLGLYSISTVFRYKAKDLHFNILHKICKG